MKTLFISTLFLIPLHLFAQAPRESLLSQIPYVPEETGKVSQPLLDVNDAFQALEPLPDFQIPQRLPNEFILTPLGWELMKRSQQANQFLVAGEPEKSVDIFRETLTKWPEELGIRVALADSLYAMGALKESVVEYKTVLARLPMHFQCLNNLAWLYATTQDPELKNVDAALELAMKAKVIQPRSHHLWSTLSQIFYEQGKYPEAENAINNALVIVQQSQVNLEVVVSYLVQRDRCTIARQATSLLE